MAMLPAPRAADLRFEPAGVAVVSEAGIRLYDWREGRLEDLPQLELPPPRQDEHELRGPAPSHPRGGGENAATYRSGQQRDLHDERAEKHLVAALRDSAEELGAIARRKGWAHVLLSGEERLAAPVRATLEHAGAHVTAGGAFPAWLTRGELMKRIARTAGAFEETAQLELLERIREGSHANGHGAAGLKACRAAAADGRIATLLVDAGEPHDDLVAAARAEGADVVAVSGEAQRLLAESEGVAALLRW